MCVPALSGPQRPHARPSDSAIGNNRAGFFDWTHFSSDLLLRITSPSWAETGFLRHPADFFERTHFCSILFLQSNARTKLVFVIETDPLLLIPRSTGRDNRGPPERQVPFFAVYPLLLIPWHTHNAFAAHALFNARKQQGSRIREVSKKAVLRVLAARLTW